MPADKETLIVKLIFIKLGIDTMVLDNDTANKRQGNEVTYKLVAQAV